MQKHRETEKQNGEMERENGEMEEQNRGMNRRNSECLQYVHSCFYGIVNGLTMFLTSTVQTYM